MRMYIVIIIIIIIIIITILIVTIYKHFPVLHQLQFRMHLSLYLSVYCVFCY